jgi:hypothetical protein
MDVKTVFARFTTKKVGNRKMNSPLGRFTVAKTGVAVWEILSEAGSKSLYW